MTHRSHRHRSRARRRILVGMGLVVLLVVGGGAFLAVTRYLPALEDARALRGDLERVVDRAAAAGLDLDRPALDAMRDDLGTAGQRFGRLDALLADDPIVAIARVLPPSRDALAGTDAVAAAGRELLAAADASLAVADRYVTIRERRSPTAAGGAAGGGSALAELVELMATGRVEVGRALLAVDRAQALLDASPRDLPGPIAQVRDLMLDRLRAYGPALRAYAEMDDTLPGILGWDGPRRYLVLTQNPAELRPTGGFIGSFGTVTFDRGRLAERRFQDVFLLDLPWDYPFIDPPAALVRYLLGPTQPWQLADANWSPDFPTSAQQAIRLYENEGGSGAIDGVIGITTQTIDEILRITGPITVADYDVTIAAGEATLKVLQNTRVARDPAENRKAFLSSLADGLFEMLLALPPTRWTELAARGDVLRTERLLLAWFAEPGAQAQIAKLGFDGSVRNDAGDYVYPVDSNVAPTSKLNAVTDRELALDVQLDAVGNATNELAVTWTNQIESEAGRPYRELRDLEDLRTMGMYFRLLVPERSRIEAVSAGATTLITAPAAVADEAGRMVISNYFRIPPGVAHLMSRWVSPYPADLGEDGIATYRLTLQKQPGLRPGPLKLRIAVPPGAVIIDASPGLVLAAQSATFETTFDRDVVVVVRYRPVSEVP